MQHDLMSWLHEIAVQEIALTFYNENGCNPIFQLRHLGPTRMSLQYYYKGWLFIKAFIFQIMVGMMLKLQSDGWA